MGLTLKKFDSVFIDTAPFIYFFEKHPQYFSSLENFFNEIYLKNIQVIISVVTYLEISVHPLRLNNKRLAAKYRDFFTRAENINLFSVDLAVAEQAAALRVKYSLKTPDAIQLGTALACGVDYIVTNNKAWRRFSDKPVFTIDEISVS